MKTPLHKLFILEVAIVVVVIITLIFSKKVMANNHQPTEVQIKLGLKSLNGQSQITNITPAKVWEVPISLLVKKAKLSFEVEFKQVTLKSKYMIKQGMGDTLLSLGYQIDEQFEISLKEKVSATSSNKYLTTGKNETSLQINYNSPMIKANNRLFATMGYTFTDKSSKFNLQNQAYASLGTKYLLKTKTQIGISLDYKENIFTHLDDQMGLTAYIDQPINSIYNLSAFAGYDITQTSTIGVTLSGKF